MSDLERILPETFLIPEGQLSKQDREPYYASYGGKDISNQEIRGRFKIQPIAKIGEGNFNQVFEVEVEFVGDHKGIFVVKRPIIHVSDADVRMMQLEDELYATRQSFEDTKKSLIYSRQSRVTYTETRNHARAKSAGMRVFPTCREIYTANGPEVLSTTGFTANKICISDKGPASISENFGIKIEEIANYEIFLSQFLDQARLAANFKRSLQLNRDAYFFLVDREDPTSVSFVAGDLSYIETSTDDLTRVENWVLNLFEIGAALQNFITKNLPSELHDEYLSILQLEVANIFRENSLAVRRNLLSILRSTRNLFVGYPRDKWQIDA